MIRALRSVAATVVVAAGLVALLATSAPQPPHLDFFAYPNPVCRGEPVTLEWAFEPAFDGPTIAIEDFGWTTTPDGTLDPSLTGTPLDASGSLVVVPRAPTYVGVTGPASVWWSPVGIDAADCSALGFQVPFADLRLTAIQTSAAGDALLGLEPDGAAAPTSRLLRWDPTLAQEPPIVLAGYAYALAVASDGRMAVAGFERPDFATASNAFVALLAPDGTELWRARLDAGQAPSLAQAVAFAPDGDLLVAGNRGGGDWRAGFLRRYADDGTLRWEHAISADDHIEATSVAVGADGRAFVAGRTRALLVGDAMLSYPAAFLRAVNGDGDALWTAQRALGWFTPTVALLTGDRALLLGADLTAFDADGKVAWAREPETDDEWVVLAPDGAGGAFVAASRETTTSFLPSSAQEHRTDVAVFRFDADGNGADPEHVLGSLKDETVVALTAWPSAGPGGVALTGSTYGSVLAPHSGGNGQETFLLVVNDDGPVPASSD